MAEHEEHPDQLPSQTLKLFGHNKAEQTLLNAYNKSRLHHGWIISGEKGLGKATLAHIFSRFLLTRPDKSQAGGLFGDELAEDEARSLYVEPEHPLMANLLAGGHGNVRIISRKYDEKKRKIPKEIGVDQVRTLVNFFNKTASEGGWRVAIVNSVDELTTNATNALLKILEEPPERSILLLVSHAPGRLLPTVLSRCQKLPLLKLSDNDVLSVLKERMPDLSDDEAETIAKIADGSPGRAIEYAEIGGLAVYKTMIELLSNVPNVKMSKLHKFAQDLAPVKSEALFEVFCDQYPLWLAKVARYKARGHEFPEIISGEKQVAENLVKTLGVEGLLNEADVANELIGQTFGLYLDRKQTIVSLFGSLISNFQKS